ncbi:MAG: DUF6913 domain-containing protein [Candidatus Cyclobacteriaceae bacterium M3_2C_046]
MKQRLVKFRTQQLLKRNKVKRYNINYAEAKSIGIIYSVEDKAKHEEIKKFIRTIELEGKVVDVISFLGKDKQNFEFMFDFFTEKDVSITGKFKPGSIHSFISKNYDYLFYIDSEPNYLIENILAQSQAKCRVGRFQQDKSSFFEMMIQQEQKNVKQLIEQMYHYTKTLASA